MKIWYQSYTRVGFDPRWKYYEEGLEKHANKVARQGTVVEIHGVDKAYPDFSRYHYFMSMHLPQIIDNALRAEREGYGAFVVGGMLDPGYFELKEVLDIPVAFIAESSCQVACLLAPRFSVIGSRDPLVLQKTEDRIRLYGLEQRYIPAGCWEVGQLELQTEFTRNPQRVIEMVTEAARKPIEQGAGALIPGSGYLGIFLANQGITQVSGVPVVDSVRAVVGTAELLVDFQKGGISRCKQGASAAPTKEQVVAARKAYGAG
ncbi:MAG: hypothetical protein HYX79_03200 [Chloroflexi bacterium]|nr:hypothetical protein [Chloroflexota bacterium]